MEKKLTVIIYLMDFVEEHSLLRMLMIQETFLYCLRHFVLQKFKTIQKNIQDIMEQIDLLLNHLL